MLLGNNQIETERTRSMFDNTRENCFITRTQGSFEDFLFLLNDTSPARDTSFSTAFISTNPISSNDLTRVLFLR